MSKKIRGFTLIELLVVIAIIGTLAAIVLVSLRGVTDKAKDARIQADLAQVRSKAVMIYAENNSSYASTCAADNTLNDGYDNEMKTLEDDIMAQMPTGGIINCQTGTNTDGEDAYCVAVTLNRATGGNKAFCIDSTGWAGPVASTSNCDATNFDCASP